MKNITIAFIGLTALLSAQVAHAEDPEQQDSVTLSLKEIVVTANKISVNKNSVPLSITVVERDEIEAGSESALLPVLSRRVPGMFITRKGVTGFGLSSNSAGSVNIRGIGGGNKVLMLFDGQPQWAGLFGHSLPDTYVASDVERVEVVRGPGSLLYGSNAMGGVVNIITRQNNAEGRHSQLRLMYGSYNTQKYMFNNGYNAGKFSSFISLNADNTDGHRTNSSFNIINGFANLGYKINEHYKAKGNASLAFYNTHNPGTIDRPMTDHIVDAGRGTTSISLTNDYDKASGAVQLFYNFGEHEINDGYPTNSGVPRTFRFHSTDHNMGVLLYETFRLFDGNTFTAGIDYKNWGGQAWNDTINGRQGEIADKSVNETAAYIIAQQTLFDILSLNAGLRFEHNGTYGNKLTPQAGLTVRPFTGNAVKLSYSNGYRSPNIRELFISYAPYSIANPNLRPEAMDNYELSISQRFGDKLSIEATLFYLDAKDLISAVEGNLTNINSIHNKGLELEASYYPSKSLAFTANYSRLKTSLPISAAPENKFFIECSYRLRRLSLTADLESISGLIKEGGTKDDKVSYALANAKVSYLCYGERTKGLTAFVKGENLTSAKYEILKGFPMPGITVMGGIEISF